MKLHRSKHLIFCQLTNPSIKRTQPGKQDVAHISTVSPQKGNAVTRHAAYDSVLREYTWTLLVLLYFAASDGAIKSNEREIICSFFKRRSPNDELENAVILEVLANFGRPDKSSFHNLVRERTAGDAVLQDIYDTSWQIVHSSSKVHTEQKRAIAYLKKSWKGRITA